MLALRALFLQPRQHVHCDPSGSTMQTLYPRLLVDTRTAFLSSALSLTSRAAIMTTKLHHDHTLRGWGMGAGMLCRDANAYRFTRMRHKSSKMSACRILSLSSSFHVWTGRADIFWKPLLNLPLRQSAGTTPSFWQSPRFPSQSSFLCSPFALRSSSWRGRRAANSIALWNPAVLGGRRTTWIAAGRQLVCGERRPGEACQPVSGERRGGKCRISL